MATDEIVIVDYKAGNIGSVANMLKAIGVKSLVTSDPSVVEKATKIILPGVGAFDYGMSKLNEFGLKDVLDKKAKEQTPVLGICLGAQLICKSSEEGILPGLGWIDAEVKRFPEKTNDTRLAVPHIGWCIPAFTKPTSHLLQHLTPKTRFYFVHSYFIRCSQPDDVLMAYEYGVPFAAAVERGNVFGVQFHPEKSHRFGKQLLQNFADLKR
jgi:imidazole glycerol-phosphate synthase subunit HisH